MALHLKTLYTNISNQMVISKILKIRFLRLNFINSGLIASLSKFIKKSEDMF